MEERPEYKVFNGKKYILHKSFSSKVRATEEAKKLRYTSPFMHQSIFARVEAITRLGAKEYRVWMYKGNR